MLRAHQIGRALFNSGFVTVADEFYYRMAELTVEYRETTGNWRHAGAMYANNAAARAAQGDMDEAVFLLAKAAVDDEKTYGVTHHDSYAVTGLLGTYFTEPAMETVLAEAQKTDSSLSMVDVESLCGFLGNRAYAFLSYSVGAWKHSAQNRSVPNEYSRLQAFSALRSLSALLEVELKLVSGNMNTEMYGAMSGLYGSKPWWKSFQNDQKTVGQTSKSTVPVDDRLKKALALSPSDAVSGFARSLLLSYIVRNYTVHQIESESAIVTDYSEEVLSHLLSTMLRAGA